MIAVLFSLVFAWFFLVGAALGVWAGYNRGYRDGASDGRWQ